MPYDRITAFGTSRGNLTDDERLRAQQGMTNQGIAAQMAALNAEIADRQAGRTFQGSESGLDRAQAMTLADKRSALDLTLDKNATDRAFGTVDRQMGPANIDAAIRQREANVKLPIEEARGAFQLAALKQAMGGMPGAGAPGAAPGGGLDADATMFMAWGGNPGEYMAQKRQQTQSDRAHQDAEDARNLALGTELMKSAKPEARALGAQILAKVKNSGLGGADPVVLQGALTPEMAPADALAKNVSVNQMFDELAALAKNTSGSFDTAGGLEQIKTKMAALVKAMTDKGVPPDEAVAYVKQELGKRVPAETGLRLGAFFPSISSVGQTRQAIGFER